MEQNVNSGAKELIWNTYNLFVIDFCLIYYKLKIKFFINKFLFFQFNFIKTYFDHICYTLKYFFMINSLGIFVRFYYNKII